MTISLMTFCALALHGQKNETMEIYTFQQHKIEHTNPEKNKTTIFVSGMQDEKVINITLVKMKEAVTELTINYQEIETAKLTDYQILTDYILDYADTPREEATLEEVITEKGGEEQIKKGVYNKVMNDALIAELLKDKLIEEDTQVYDLMILYEKMYFNGKQQSAEMAKRYKALYEDLSGVKIQRTTFYHLSQTL
jgi:hypothetical protein